LKKKNGECGSKAVEKKSRKKSLQDFFKKKHEKSGEVWIENEFICEI